MENIESFPKAQVESFPKSSSTLYTQLALIQKELKAPKTQVNNFGKYMYRSCSDILEAVKPLLNGLSLLLTDQILVIQNRNYVEACAILTNGIERIEVKALAREPIEKKGMDDSQITGATSSYARKYALNGLFAIDDTKDADSDGFNRYNTNSGVIDSGVIDSDYCKPIGAKAEVSQPPVSRTQGSKAPSGTQRPQIIKTVPMKKDIVKKTYSYEDENYDIGGYNE